MRGARSAVTEKTSAASFSEGSPSGDAGAPSQSIGEGAQTKFWLALKLRLAKAHIGCADVK